MWINIILSGGTQFAAVLALCPFGWPTTQTPSPPSRHCLQSLPSCSRPGVADEITMVVSSRDLPSCSDLPSRNRCSLHRHAGH